MTEIMTQDERLTYYGNSCVKVMQRRWQEMEEEKAKKEQEKK